MGFRYCHGPIAIHGVEKINHLKGLWTRFAMQFQAIMLHVDTLAGLL